MLEAIDDHACSLSVDRATLQRFTGGQQRPTQRLGTSHQVSPFPVRGTQTNGKFITGYPSTSCYMGGQCGGVHAAPLGQVRSCGDLLGMSRGLEAVGCGRHLDKGRVVDRLQVHPVQSCEKVFVGSLLSKLLIQAEPIPTGQQACHFLLKPGP